jgi:adenylate cyclase
MRAVMRHLPSEPRCKVCANPFGGLGGKAVGLFGFKPSRKNPNVCGACCDSLPSGGAEVDVAVLFADVRGSTPLAEQLGTEAYAALLNRFYRTATDVLLRHDAIIDKLIGDEVMALFIRGVARDDYRPKACRAGLELLQAVANGDGTAWLPLGVAVHAGPAFVGNVGTSVVDFTALGDTVNTAARLQAEAKAGELVLSDDIWASCPESRAPAERREVHVRGKAEPVPVRVIRPA